MQRRFRKASYLQHVEVPIDLSRNVAFHFQTFPIHQAVVLHQAAGYSLLFHHAIALDFLHNYHSCFSELRKLFRLSTKIRKTNAV